MKHVLLIHYVEANQTHTLCNKSIEEYSKGYNKDSVVPTTSLKTILEILRMQTQHTRIPYVVCEECENHPVAVMELLAVL